VKIVVTQSDIELGTPDSCAFCPIALAATRAYPDADYVDVGPDRIEVHYWDGCKTDIVFRDLPMIAQQFIEDFDSGETVQPFEFELS